MYVVYRSDLGSSVSFEGVGLVDNSLSTVGVWARDSPDGDQPSKFDKGLVFYVMDDTVCGMLMFNVPNKVHIARKIIEDRKSVNEIQSIVPEFDIHNQQIKN